MPPTSPAAHAVANRLLARAPAPADASKEPADPIAAAEWIGRALAIQLSRAFGLFGYHALLTRALVEASRVHSVLAVVRVRAPSDPVLDGLTDAARTHGGTAAAEGAAAVLAGVVELLSRLIGEDMAVNMVEQAVPISAPNAERAINEETSS